MEKNSKVQKKEVLNIMQKIMEETIADKEESIVDLEKEIISLKKTKSAIDKQLLLINLLERMKVDGYNYGRALDNRQETSQN